MKWTLPETILFIIFFFVSSFLAPVGDYFDSLVLVFSLMIFPMAAVLLIVLLVPLWATTKALIKALRKDYGSALRYIAVPVLGIACFFAGQAAGDFIAIRTIGPAIMSAVQAARDGKATERRGFFISKGEPKIAFLINGGFLDITQGIAYDETDTLDVMMRLKPDERPQQWQSHAVDVLSCKRGSAPHWQELFRGCRIWPRL